MQDRSNTQLHALTGLRFFAAALVVTFHFSKPGKPWIKHFVDHGAFGVTIFFVLSGFILAYGYSLGPGVMRGSLRSFWAARCARLYPTYVLGMALMAPFVLFTSEAPGWLRVASGLLSLAGLQAWFDALGLSWSMWNPPGWSLSAEAFFYLLFPAACMAMSRLSSGRLLACALASWVLSVLGIFTNVVIEGDFWEFVPLVRVPEFLLGMAAGLMWKNRRTAAFDRAAPVIATVSALAMTGLMCLPLSAQWFFSGALAPLAALFICALACGRGWLAAVLAWKPFVFLGGASYSLYILHWPAWQFWQQCFGKSQLAAQQPHVYFVAYFMFTTLAACLCFKYFEEPLNVSLRRRLMSPSPHAQQAGATVAQQGALPG